VGSSACLRLAAARNHFIAANAITLLRRLQADAADVFSGNWEQIALGPGAGAGRPGQVIRLRPKTHQRHMDWLTWCLTPVSTAGDHRAPQPIHACHGAVG
jgi:hypothetical protein